MPDPTFYDHYLSLLNYIRGVPDVEVNAPHEPMPGEAAPGVLTDQSTLGQRAMGAIFGTGEMSQPVVPYGRDIPLNDPQGSRMGPVAPTPLSQQISALITDPTKPIRQAVRSYTNTPDESWTPVDALGLLSQDWGGAAGGGAPGHGISLAELPPAITGEIGGGATGGSGPLSARQIAYRIKKNGGISVHPTTGEVLTPGQSIGTMVGTKPNASPYVSITPLESFTPSTVRDFLADPDVSHELGLKDRYLGGWIDTDKETGAKSVYLDVSKRVQATPQSDNPNALAAAQAAQIRRATKLGEGPEQLNPDPAIREANRQKKIYDLKTEKELPVGSVMDFLHQPIDPNDPLQRSAYDQRAEAMAAKGREYLATHAGQEWWDLHGSDIERVYGSDPHLLNQIAGFMSVTAPVTTPEENLRVASEYIRRQIKGEPILQPDYRMPTVEAAGAMGATGGPGGTPGAFRPGRKMPMEAQRTANLMKASAGDLEALQRSKVRSEAQALIGNPDVAVLDTHQAKLAEDPARGVYVSKEEGIVDEDMYPIIENRLRFLAQRAGRNLRDYSADVWAGIRETINETGALYGTRYKRSSGESVGYAATFTKILAKKAQRLGLSVPELEAKLRSGDANLLTAILSTGVGLSALNAWQQKQDSSIGAMK